MLVGTSGPSVPRLVLSAALAAGADPRWFAGIPATQWLGSDDKLRVRTTELLRMWEVAAPALIAAGGAPRVAANAAYGSLHLYDHLVGSAATLSAGLRTGARHVHLIVDPAERIVVTQDATGVTETYVWARETSAADLIDEYAAAQLLQQARLATGRHLTPVRVQLAGRAPARYGHLVDWCGTRRIEFNAPHTSVSFAPADAELALPRADRALSLILSDYAERFLATTRPVLGWLDAFHAALSDCCIDAGPELARVAHRLAMSPRTLQRRLRQEGTSWRQELERIRQQQAERLLRTTPLSVEAIAARVGYSDVRALRRAVRRWYGKSPAELRLHNG